MKNGKPLMQDARFRDRLSRVEIELTALELTAMRFLDAMRRTGQPPGADVSMLKIKGTEIQQALTELMMQAIGPQAQPFVAVEGGKVDGFESRLSPRCFKGLPSMPRRRSSSSRTSSRRTTTSTCRA